ncbi:uroporphyrinogen-III synthase [Bacillus sp. DJP31]|uniref:uroporphyrinogen-III synthase n=1 Tax=Bacillus sp. DJP31 TaxID=3409789 RepID=UPI003BB497AE
MDTQPLANKTIVITRAEEKSREFARQIKDLGGTPLILPLLAFLPAVLTPMEKLQLNRLNEFDWLVFTSVNGVEYFFQQSEQLSIDTRGLQAKIAVVGDKTKLALKKRGLEAFLLPTEFVAEGLIRDLQNEKLEGKKVLYIRGNLARDLIPKQLGVLGAKVTKLTVYTTVCPTHRLEWLEILNQNVDAITFTSPSTINHFVQLLEGTDWKSWIQRTVVCCIGPITEKAAQTHGIIPNIVPQTYTMDHLLQELLSFFEKRGGT